MSNCEREQFRILGINETVKIYFENAFFENAFFENFANFCQKIPKTIFTVSFIPKIRNCSPSQFDTIYRISQPSPACRVSTDSNDSKCRSTNLKKFSKISRLLLRGREPRGAAPARSLSAMGKTRDSAIPSAFPPCRNPPNTP